MSPDRAPSTADMAVPSVLPTAVATSPVSAGWLEIALPLWNRRWRLLFSMLLCGVLAFGASLTRPLRFQGQASFIVQPVLRPSQSAVAGALPALAGLIGGGSSPVDLHVAILRSQAVSDRIIDRFELQRTWGLQFRTLARNQLARRVSFGISRRDGVVQITVEDEFPARAAGMANEYIEELRAQLRGFTLEEAKQRRTFYDTQLALARQALEAAQKNLQGSGFDGAALRSEPRAAAEAYGRMQAEVTAAELRLTATRRVRADGSAEVQQAQADVAALRGQLARLERPDDKASGAFVGRVREYRYAEALAESIARQAEGARVDEASDPVPLQVLDRATAAEMPSSPQPLKWAAAGLLLGGVLYAGGVLLRHRMRLARLDAAYVARIALIRSVLPGRR